MKYVHEPLRIPENWRGQDRQFVIQLERLLDDVYMKLAKQSETETGLKDAVSALDDRVTALED